MVFMPFHTLLPTQRYRFGKTVFHSLTKGLILKKNLKGELVDFFFALPKQNVITRYIMKHLYSIIRHYVKLLWQSVRSGNHFRRAAKCNTQLGETPISSRTRTP